MKGNIEDIIRFGPSGNSNEFFEEGYKHTEQAIAWVAEKGLNAYEYSFGKGVSISDAKAAQIGAQAAACGVKVSVHAPYYINLANPSEEMIEKSLGYLESSATKVRLLGGNRVVFHVATEGKAGREAAFALSLDRMKRLTEFIYEKGLDDVLFCPETMGKRGQIGTLEEIAEFCAIDKVFVPTIDFGHLNARDCGVINREGYGYIIEYLLDNMALEKVKYMHVHFSKIMFGAKGEIKHLTFADEEYGPCFEPLAEQLVKHGLLPTILCESDGTQAKDALYMKNAYINALERQ
ncbi:MAG: TIM barrel protein [Clostridia bacterium]|nr:TIM barrel protein [Clostridia bacterium]